MTVDTELDGWREDWQAQSQSIPALRPTSKSQEADGTMVLPHAAFLDDAIRRVRFRFWKWPERLFLAGLRRQLQEEDVRMHGRRMSRRKKKKGGLSI